MATPAAAAAATARHARKPCVGRLHFPAEPAEAACTGLANAFQLGAHLPAADRREADADPLLSHGSDPSVR